MRVMLQVYLVDVRMSWGSGGFHYHANMVNTPSNGVPSLDGLNQMIQVQVTFGTK